MLLTLDECCVKYELVFSIIGLLFYLQDPVPPEQVDRSGRQQMVDVRPLLARVQQLDDSLNSTSYNRSKCSLSQQLDSFLHSLPTAKCLDTATPHDLRLFLVSKERTGRTKLHSQSCVFRGLSQSLDKPQCSCPLTTAAGSVDSLIGRLRAIFRDRGRGTEWVDSLGIGNPAASPLIKGHLKAVKLEQKAALVQPKQARPLMFDKILPMVRLLSYQYETGRDVISRYLALRDRAFFKIVAFAGDRAHDLGLAQTAEIQCVPDKEGRINGYLFNHTLGKTLRGDSVNSFWIWRSNNCDICPVSELLSYISFTRLLGIDLTDGYLFRPKDPGGHCVLNKPVSSSAMNLRLESHLKVLNLYEGETLHGVRAGTAIAMELLQIPKDQILSHIGWAHNKSDMMSRYTRLHEVSVKQDCAKSLAAAADVPALGTRGKSRLELLGHTYKSQAYPTNLKPAFPHCSKELP